MNTPQDGGPAFPQHGWSSNPETVARMEDKQGLTMRDWFAGMALQAIVSKTESQIVDMDETLHEFQSARGAYGYADAMLAVREGKQTP